MAQTELLTAITCGTHQQSCSYCTQLQFDSIAEQEQIMQQAGFNCTENAPANGELS